MTPRAFYPPLVRRVRVMAETLNATEIARELGMDRDKLRVLCRRHGIVPARAKARQLEVRT